MANNLPKFKSSRNLYRAFDHLGAQASLPAGFYEALIGSKQARMPALPGDQLASCFCKTFAAAFAL